MTRQTWFLLAILTMQAAVARGEDRPPLDLDVSEKAGIKLMLVNSVVVDAEGRAVPGLGLTDFSVELDGKLVQPVSVDESCPEFPVDEAGVRTKLPASSAPRRMIIALDYQHLTAEQRMGIFDWIRDTVRRRMTDSDQLMIVALTGGLRPVVPFTSNRDEAIRALDAMERDVTLFGGYFKHINETAFVDSLTALFDIVAPVPGPKALVLFSAMRSFPFEQQFREVASYAASAEVSIYPVDARGLFVGSVPRWGGMAPLGFTTNPLPHPQGNVPRLATSYEEWEALEWDFGCRPAMSTGREATAGGTTTPRAETKANPIPSDEGLPPLARLATDSGGRFTERSNDIGLGLARAQRDLTCIYTLAIREDDRREDVMRRLKIRTRNPELRVFHPEFLTIRSDKSQRDSLVRAAYLSPALFDTGALQVQFVPRRPASANAWEGALAVSFPSDMLRDARGENALRFGAAILTGALRAKEITRTITNSGERTESGAGTRFALAEPLTLSTGKYTITAVLSDPLEVRPSSARGVVDLPEIPRGEPLVVGPVLLVPSSAADADDVELAGPQRIAGPRDLRARTRICVVDADARQFSPSVTRTLRDASGAVVGSFPAERVDLHGEGAVQCGEIVDTIPARMLASRGTFSFEASLDTPRKAKPFGPPLSFTVDAGEEAAQSR